LHVFNYDGHCHICRKSQSTRMTKFQPIAKEE
jgi:hypothetical protein